MTFHILLNHIATVFLSTSMLTTLSFESEVESFIYGGGKAEVFLELTNKNKTLAIKAHQNINSNLLVVTKKRKYYFDLKTGDRPHRFIEVKHGAINGSHKEIYSEKSFKILEGRSSRLVVNKSKKEILVNGLKVDKKEYFSKGDPLFINGRRVL